MLDEGETDWKIICIDARDTLAAELNSCEDVESKMPGLLEATKAWFRSYKVPDGKPRNEFAFEGRFLGKEKALQVIRDTHEMWRKLKNGKVPAKKDNAYAISVNESPESFPASDLTELDAQSVQAINSSAPQELYFV